MPALCVQIPQVCTRDWHKKFHSVTASLSMSLCVLDISTCYAENYFVRSKDRNEGSLLSLVQDREVLKVAGNLRAACGRDGGHMSPCSVRLPAVFRARSGRCFERFRIAPPHMSRSVAIILKWLVGTAEKKPGRNGSELGPCRSVKRCHRPSNRATVRTRADGRYATFATFFRSSMCELSKEPTTRICCSA